MALEKGNPVNDDLTMINKEEPINMGPSDEDIASMGNAVGSLAPTIDSVEDVPGAIRASQDAEAFGSSISNVAVDPDLDQFKSMYEDTNAVRARNQSEAIKGLKAVGGGIYQGSLIFLEQLGYVADLDTYTNLFAENEDLSGNWWTQLMKEAQESGRESDMFKIYEDAPDHNNLMGQIFKWSSLEGAISSAVGFGLSGLGAASVVSAIGATKKFQTIAKLADKAMGNLKGASTYDAAYAAAIRKGLPAAQAAERATRMQALAVQSAAGSTGAFVGPLASSMTSNYYMGQMMASDTYKQSMDALRSDGAIGDGEGQISEFEAQKLANNNAQEVVGLNMALTATAYLKFGGIFKKGVNKKALISNPSAINQLKDMVVKGSPTAFTANVYQEMIQMEQIEDTKKGAGLSSDYSANYWDRITQLALSERALHAGALGIVGGPIQFATIQVPMMGKQMKAQKEAYTKQQKTLTYIEELKNNKLKTFSDFDSAKKTAILQGDATAVDLAEKMGVIEEFTSAVEWGTLSILRNDIEKISQYTKEEAKAADFDLDYKETADNLLATIDRTEQLVAENVWAENTGEVVYNQLVLEEVIMKDLLDKASYYPTVDGVIAKLKEDGRVPAEVLDSMRNDKFEVRRDPNRFKDKDKATVLQMKADETRQDKILSELLATNPDMKNLDKQRKVIEKNADLSKQLIARRQLITSKKYQKEYKDGQVNAKENYQANVEKAAEKSTEKAAKDKADTWANYNEVKNAGKALTPVEQKEADAKFAEKVKGTSVVKEGFTFTSKDKNAERRLYGKNDIVATYDGRFFKVLNQAGAGDAKGGLRHLTMPALIETDAKGKIKKGATKTVPHEHSFLRPEVLQFLPRGVGRKGYYASSWAPYTAADSDIKPNNLSYNIRRQERAEQGEAVTVRNHELVTNTPRGAIEKTEFAKEYAVHELNEPFKGDYEVELKLNKMKGEGNTFIDVYKTDENGKQYKLTRLDRHSNLNHTAIAVALSKGPVFATITEHYSEKGNLVISSNDLGEKIYSSLDDMNRLTPKANLINGQVYIASKTGENTNEMKRYAVSQDGKDFSENGFIDVKIDGVVERKTIPFNSMFAGDTYALILAPSGLIVPVALSSKTLADIPGVDGEGTKLAEVAEMHEKAVREFYTDRLDDIDAFEAPISAANTGDEVINSQAQLDNSLRDSEASQANRYDPTDLVFESREDLRNFFNNNVYKEVRSTRMYVQNYVKEAWTEVRNYEGRKIFDENFFQMYAAVDSKGKLVPAVKVRNPNDPTKTHTYNTTDHYDDYMAHLGMRRRRFNLDDFKNVADGGENTVNTAIKNGELTTDLNLTQPIAGSSATVKIDGKDIQEGGFKAAAANRKVYGNKVDKAIREATELTKTEFLQDLNKNYEDFIENTTEDESATELVKFAKELYTNLDVVNGGDLSVLINQAFTDEGLPGMEIALEQALNEIQPDPVNDPVPNAKILAQVKVLNAVVNEQITSGTLKLRLVSDEVDSTYGQQREDIKFGRSAPAYHSTYRDVTIKEPLKKGYYYVTVKGKKGSIKVAAKDLYSPKGDFRKLFEARKNLRAAKAKDNKSYIEVAQRAVDSLVEKLTREGFMGAKTADSAVNTATTKTTINSDGSAPTINSELVDALFPKYISPADLPTVKKFYTTDRTQAIHTAIVGLTNTSTQLTAIVFDPLRALELPTETFRKEFLGDMIKAIPYTSKELESLIAIGDSKIKTAVSEKQKSFFSAQRNKLASVKSLLDTLTNASIGNDGKFTKTNYKGDTLQASVPSLDGTSMTYYAELKEFIEVVGESVSSAVIGEYNLNSNLFSSSVGSKSIVTPVTAKKTDKAPKAEPKVEPTPKVKPKTEPAPPPKGDLITDGDVTDASIKASIKDRVPSATSEELATISRQVLAIIDNDSEATGLMYLEEMISTLEKDKGPKASVNDAFGLSDTTVVDDGDVPFKLGSRLTSTPEEFKGEVAIAKSMLPQVPLVVVENMALMYKKYGRKALGAWDNGTRFLVQNAENGTAYHETMHAIADLYLTDAEKLAIAKEHGYDAWSVEVDEKLAEGFEKYAMNIKPGTILSKTRAFFKAIFDYVRGARSIDVTKQVFEKTIKGGYATSKSISTLENVAAVESVPTLDAFKENLTDKESVTLQNRMNDNKIKIVC